MRMGGNFLKKKKNERDLTPPYVKIHYEVTDENGGIGAGIDIHITGIEEKVQK